jgi:hypothetical protein
MAQVALNRYLSDLLVESELSILADLMFYEISFKNLTNFANEAKEIFKKFLKKNESEVANTYGITIIEDAYKSTKD